MCYTHLHKHRTVPKCSSSYRIINIHGNSYMRPITICSDVEVHSHSNNTMYEWALWRLHVNNTISRELNRQENKARQRTASKARFSSEIFTDSLNPDYGLACRVLRETWPGSPHLGGSMFLMYGLPRAHVRRPPAGIRKLHGSQQSGSRRLTNINSSTTDQSDHDGSINHFEKASIITRSSNNNLGPTDAAVGMERMNLVTSIVSISNKEDIYSENQRCQNQDTNIKEMMSTPDSKSNTTLMPAATIRNGNKLPFVSRGRKFWENLAKNRASIIELGRRNKDVSGNKIGFSEKPNNGSVDNHLGNSPKHIGSSSHEAVKDDTIVSEDILRKQYTLLRKTKEPKPRASKALWRSLADSKTEILLMQDLDNDGKRQEGRAKNLWGFLFSKDKELKALNKAKNKNTPSDSLVKHRRNHTETPRQNIQKAETGPLSFQEELAARVQRRRQVEESGS